MKDKIRLTFEKLRILNTIIALRRKIRSLIPYRVNISIYSSEPFYGIKRFTYQNKFNRFDIQSGERVLDIGFGADPFPLATHLADCEVGPDRYEKLKVDSRPFTQCSIEKLPYSDKYFDFVYASHVMEHTINPQHACEELMRVGKRGYIETPTRMSDILFGFASIKSGNKDIWHHNWYVVAVGNCLIFVEYQDKERRKTDFKLAYQLAYSKYDNFFRRFYQSNRDLFSSMLLWEDHFDYYVFNKFGELISHSGMLHKK